MTKLNLILKIAVSISIGSAWLTADASVKIHSVSAKHGSQQFLLFGGGGSPERMVMRAAGLETQSSHSASQLVESSKVVLSSGAKVYKYAHHYRGKPIVGDWAMATVAKGGWLDSVQYQISKPQGTVLQSAKIETGTNGKLASTINTKTVWQMPESSIVKNIQTLGLKALENSIRQVWFKQAQTLIAAYSVTAGEMLDGHPVLYTVLIDAESGQMLQKALASTHLTEYKYRIYADGTPLQPFQNPYGYTSPSTLPEPGDPRPSAFVEQQDFSISELSNTVDDPWLPEGATETVGNNVDVFYNFTRTPEGVFDFGGDGFGPEYRSRGDESDQDFRAPISDQNELSFDYDAIDYQSEYLQFFESDGDPNAEQVRAIHAQQVQAFYLANFLRDLFYDAGFTESAGNAQTSNYGRGGIEGDPLIIHINSFTFIFAPMDGESPVIQLGRTSGGNTALDTTVFAHEWTHYMHRRLVNPTLLITNNQSRALNEGWADVVGVLMGMKAQDFADAQSAGFQSTYAIGDYFRQDFVQNGFLNPFFYGIRRYPYGPANPFTFEHIAHKAPLPNGFDFSIYLGRGTQNSQIHTAGEIWADTVLACFRDVIASSGSSSFIDTRQQLANYIVGAMAMTPQNPTFLEARDALLAAVRADSVTNFNRCRLRFVNKGMGSGSVAPPRESKEFTERVSSFLLGDFNLSVVQSQLVESAGGLDSDGILDNGENGVLELTLRNTGFEVITEADIQLLEDSSSYQTLGSGQVAITDLAIGADVTIRLPLRLTHERNFDLTLFAIEVSIAGESTLKEQSFRTHFDIAKASVTNTISNKLEIAFQDWQLDRIELQSFVDSRWQVEDIDGNELLQVDEPFLATERSGVTRAFVSPWLRRSDEVLRFEFSQAFNLPGTLHIEVSTDDETWMSFDEAIPFFTGISDGFPSLAPVSLINTSVQPSQRFKMRIRLESGTPLTSRMDDFKLSGVEQSPFNQVIVEDGVDLNSLCVPIKTNQGITVVCL